MPAALQAVGLAAGDREANPYPASPSEVPTMNALTKARESIAELLDALHQTSQARMAAQARQRQPEPAPRATKLYACGSEWRVLDAETGRLLAWRPSQHEAAELATRLELGLQLHH